ncbi:hypothetical protein HMN09_01196600 [Mycena chlorophos]|uniref:Uncharacterized protein n=1 Tax=Mycena chlorophos TaxID=658473 RepID=A0A8H6S6W1_MYCCL|nr:hypothetical protein HMN09_01196600 [Mycena chlorophos]
MRSASDALVKSTLSFWSLKRLVSQTREASDICGLRTRSLLPPKLGMVELCAILVAADLNMDMVVDGESKPEVIYRLMMTHTVQPKRHLDSDSSAYAGSRLHASSSRVHTNTCFLPTLMFFSSNAHISRNSSTRVIYGAQMMHTYLRGQPAGLAALVDLSGPQGLRRFPAAI